MVKSCIWLEAAWVKIGDIVWSKSNNFLIVNWAGFEFLDEPWDLQGVVGGHVQSVVEEHRLVHKPGVLATDHS